MPDMDIGRAANGLLEEVGQALLFLRSFGLSLRVPGRNASNRMAPETQAPADGAINQGQRLDGVVFSFPNHRSP